MIQRLKAIIAEKDAEIARLMQERDLKAGMLVDALATLARLKQGTPA